MLLNHALRHATDGFIGILDMFGFEDSKPSQLEQLCINLCSETMQHFYNTHIFKSSVESCKEEGITSDANIDYVDNVPCIDLISSLVRPPSCIMFFCSGTEGPILFHLSYLITFFKLPTYCISLNNIPP